ncbi:MAG: hypothetical protein OCU22_08275 [Canidatus Methanoxibalbensis ujae]|nr:hypothetical protein [Candidatus Methanoxibalbensis ujae]
MNPLANITSAELKLRAKSVVPGPTEEFLDKVYLNEKEIGALNDYIPAQAPDEDAMDVAIPILLRDKLGMRLSKPYSQDTRGRK